MEAGWGERRRGCVSLSLAHVLAEAWFFWCDADVCDAGSSYISTAHWAYLPPRTRRLESSIALLCADLRPPMMAMAGLGGARVM
jgi:hypothetical protein